MGLVLFPKSDIAIETNIIFSIAVIHYSGMHFYRTWYFLLINLEFNMIFKRPEWKTESFSMF